MEPDEQLAKQLFDAIREEDEQKLKYALEKGVPLNVLDPVDDNHKYHGITAFLFAVRRGWEAGFRLLAEHGADLHEVDNDGTNAMHCISWRAYAHQEVKNIALLLLEHGIAFDAPTKADDTTNRIGQTPVMFAAENGNNWQVNLLLQQGAEVNRQDANGTNALCHAARNLHLDIVKTLLEEGAEPNVVANELWTPLQRVINYRAYEAAVMLLDAGADPNITNHRKENALHALCQQGIVWFGITAPFSNEILYPNYDNVIVGPSLQNRIAIALFEHGVQIDARDHKGNTPLMLALNQDMYDIVHLLIEKKADASLCSTKQQELIQAITLPADQQYSSPHISHMLAAIAVGDTHRVDSLIQCGLDINSTTVNGHNALHYAVGYVSSDRERIVDVLLNAGIDYDARSYPSDTRLETALSSQRAATFRNLRLPTGAPMQRGSTPLMVAAAMNNLYGIERLIQAGADINSKNADGNTALFYAARAANIDALKLLLQHGADANTICMSSYTPLRVMVYFGSLEGVTALLQSGADPNQLGFFGQTALHAACDRSYIEKCLLPEGATPLSDDESSEAFDLRFQLVKLLVSHGADLNVGGRRNTPLGLALRNDFYTLAKVLLQLGADPSLCTVHQQAVIKQLLL